MRTFSGEIEHLGRQQVFVFGSNTQGRHGKGAALTAKQKFGAIYGQPEGRQGQSYAIVTKNLMKRDRSRSVPLEYISLQVRKFLEYARLHPDLSFFVVKFGSSLAGFDEEEIAELFVGFDIPCNVYMNKDYADIIDKHWTTQI